MAPGGIPSEDSLGLPNYPKKNGKLQAMNFRITYFLVLVLPLIITHNSSAQWQGKFFFDTVKIPQWPAVHSFAFAATDTYILIIGGRKDGIHEKESGFEYINSNSQIYLWNIDSQRLVTYPIDHMDEKIINFFSAANSNFTQDEKYLYIAGGYGQTLRGNFTTQDIFMRIDIADCIERIIKNEDILPAIKQMRNPYFAVTGGQLRKLDSVFYLVGGHLFEGKYSSNSSIIQQKYTDAVRGFQIDESGDSITLKNKFEIINDFNFHRRDFNMNPVIDQNGQVKLMVYSGVFQYNVDRPFLNTALVHGQDFEEILDFDHKFAAYTCSRIGFYDKALNQMHQVFLGGMAEYYRDSVGTMIQDALVPFVKSVSCVSRDESGKFKEFLMEEELPAFIGTNSEVYLNPSLPLYKEDIIDFDELKEDTTFIGYLFGGIYHPYLDRNPWQNDRAHLTRANPYLTKISYVKSETIGTKEQNKKQDYRIDLFPNPTNSVIDIQFDLNQKVNNVVIWIQNAEGKILKTLKIKELPKTELRLNIEDLPTGNYSVYFLVNNHSLSKKNISVIQP